MFEKEQAVEDKRKFYENEARQKRNVMADANQCAGGAGSLLRPSSLRERVHRALAEGESNMRRLEAAHRAKQIIDEHPEFAELLDLLGQF